MTIIISGLSDQPLDVTELINRIRSSECGAVVSFEGTTRARSLDNQTVTALFYEAYEQRATKQLQDLTQSAVERWPLRGVVAVHRTGHVGAGEPGVLVAVTSKHRAMAFEACAFLIDAIKHDAAIWKKEIYSDGASAWVGTPTPSKNVFQ
jgi:molybdopterin synthase catalytic subunit